MNILSIQSHVAYGHVGNRSAVFPLERMGFEVWPINTVQFSSHTGRPGWTGAAFGSDKVSGIVRSMETLGVLASCDAVLSGYMSDAATGAAIIEAVDAVKKANPDALYCCDPVMGDMPGGLYVQAALPEFMINEAMPRADIVVPNRFEAELLSGIAIKGPTDAIRAADAIHAMGPRIVIITSYKRDGEDSVGFFISDGALRLTLMTPALCFAKPPKGSGDLSSALFLGYFLKIRDIRSSIESTAGALYAVLEATLEATLAQAGDELAIVAAQDAIANPPRRFIATTAIA